MSARTKSTSQTTSRKSAINMVLGQLYTNEITDKRILDAIASTPRELFVPNHLSGAAYVDEDLDMGNGRSLLAPMTFAKLITLAGITPQCRVLDIGCLSGYSASVLSKLAAHVVAVDTDADAITNAKKILKDVPNLDIQQVKSLADGYGVSAPYDVIIIEGAISFVPEVIGLQLAEGGRMATIFCKGEQPGLSHGAGKGLLIKRLEGSLQYREHFDAASALLPGFERETGFTL